MPQNHALPAAGSIITWTTPGNPWKNAFCSRTQLFSRVRENTLAIKDYQAIIRHKENPKRIYSTIYTCEFVGFLDEGFKRVGCMLHPADE